MTTETTSHEVSAFGLPLTPNEQNPLFADGPIEGDTVVAPEVEGEVVAEEATEPPAPAGEEPAAEPAESVEEPAAEPAAEPTTVEELIFGKYKDLDAAKQGYDNLRDLQRRTAERARAFEQENAAVLERARELETTLQQAIPLIKTLQERQQFDQYGEPVPAPATPPLTPEMVNLLVETRTREAIAQAEAQRQQAELMASRESTVMSFYEKHPEVDIEGEIDGQIYDAIKALNDAWDKADTEVNVGDSDTLEIVYEASKSPELLKVLQMNPQLIDDDQGMQLARFQAALMRGETITQQTRTVPASQVGQRGLPVTESASTGGSAPAAEPTNEWTEAKRALAESRGRGTGSPFFESGS